MGTHAKLPPFTMVCLGCANRWDTRARSRVPIACPSCGKRRKVPAGRPGGTPSRASRVLDIPELPDVAAPANRPVRKPRRPRPPRDLAPLSDEQIERAERRARGAELRAAGLSDAQVRARMRADRIARQESAGATIGDIGTVLLGQLRAAGVPIPLPGRPLAEGLRPLPGRAAPRPVPSPPARPADRCAAGRGRGCGPVVVVLIAQRGATIERHSVCEAHTAGAIAHAERAGYVVTLNRPAAAPVLRCGAEGCEHPAGSVVVQLHAGGGRTGLTMRACVAHIEAAQSRAAEGGHVWNVESLPVVALA